LKYFAPFGPLILSSRAYWAQPSAEEAVIPHNDNDGTYLVEPMMKSNCLDIGYRLRPQQLVRESPISTQRNFS